MKAEDIDDTYYLNAYNEIKKTKDTYDKAKDEGKSDIDASNEAGKDLNDTMTDKVQQDVQDKHDMATGKGNYDIDDGGTSFIKDGVGRNINETINIFWQSILDAVNAIMQNVMLSNEDEESPLAKVASIIGDVFDVVNSEKKTNYLMQEILQKL